MAAKSGSLRAKILLAVLAPLVFLAVLEGVLRATGFEYTARERTLWKPTIAGYVGTFEFYLPTEFDPPGYIWVTQPNTEYTDRYGFRLPEIPVEKPPSKIRVAFLGGSTTHGGYRPYPERVIRLINSAIGTNRYEMLNVSCSSYSTHQSVIALTRWVLPRDADIVMVYHGWNDRNVLSDGFNDREKDAVANRIGNDTDPSGSWLKSMKTGSLLGRVVDGLDRGWPRPRVSMDEFRDNLDTIASACGERGIRCLVMGRPQQLDQDLALADFKEDSHQVTYVERLFGTHDRHEVYRLLADRLNEIQREVAEAHGNAEFCDGRAMLNEIQEARLAGEYGEHALVLQPDATHLRPLGEEEFAQRLAPVVAPEHAEAIRAFIDSVAYNRFLAKEFLVEMLPFGATYYAGRAMAFDTEGTYREELAGIIAEAESLTRFALNFREGRWGGIDKDVDSQLAKLKACLDERPNDWGVCLQVVRVCIYNQRMGDAAPVMMAYKPTTAQNQFEWAHFLLQSHLEAQRFREAIPVARALVKMNPNHEPARSFLAQVEQQTRSSPAK